MATKAEIKKVILDLAGNPSVGAIYTLSDKWAEAIWLLDNKNVALEEESDPVSDASVGIAKRETRITKPTEKR